MLFARGRGLANYLQGSVLKKIVRNEWGEKRLASPVKEHLKQKKKERASCGERQRMENMRKDETHLKVKGMWSVNDTNTCTCVCLGMCVCM